MISVSVRGLDRVARGLRALAARVRDLSPAWRLLGARAVQTARPLTPVKSARLVNAIRSRPTSGGLEVGVRGVVYAGVQNFGWAARNIRARHFLEGGPTEELLRRDAPREAEALLTRTARMAGLT
jgi:hypothetical protein